jgi:hypothetical protein
MTPEECEKAVADLRAQLDAMTRYRDNAVEDVAEWMGRAGKLAGGVDVAAIVREAVAAERGRCLSHLVNAITDWLAAPDLLTLADVRRLMGQAEDRIREGNP